MNDVRPAGARRWIVGGLVALFALGACAEKKKRRSYDDDDDDEPRRRTKASASVSASSSAERVAVGPLPSNVGAVELRMFVMSQCPYGVQAEAMVKEIADQLGPDLRVVIDYIGREKDGDLTSMHGPAEVTGDIAQLCAARHAPKLLDFLECQNKDMKSVDTNWRSCAEDLALPVAEIESCLTSSTGKDLLRASFNRAAEKNASGSPTIFVAGEKYSGSRKRTALTRAICDAYSGARPAACNEIPPAAKVNVTLLVDSRCKDCDTKRFETPIKSKIENPDITIVDYATPAGKSLYDTLKPGPLPVLVFDSTLDGDPEAKRSYEKLLQQAGSYRFAAAGGNWNPVCADTGGCSLPECGASLACRAEKPNKLELFVMSQCPFGAKALIALEEVLANFKKHGAKLDFTIHWIGSGGPTDLKSMHGQAEVDEDLRQVCAQKYYSAGLKYLDYMVCRARDYKNTDWQRCTGGKSGLDASVIKTCSEGPEGKSLLAASFALSKASGVAASPTWFVNGTHKLSGIDAETIKSHVCKLNTLPGCSVTLSGPPPKAPPRP